MADDVVGLRYISEGLPEMLREIKSYQTAVSGVQRAERQKASATKESSRATSQNTQETKKAAQAEKEWFALQRQRVQLRQNSARREERAIQQVAQAQRAQDAADRAAYQRYIRYQNEKAAAAQRFAREQARAAEQAAAAERKLAAEKDRLTAKYNPLYAASKQYERALNEIARAQQIGALNAKQHEAAVEQLNREFQAFQSGTAGWSNQFVTGSQRGARSMNRMGMVMQQTGYQVGDFLVQIQGGTNWMVAFGQQATQLVGVLPMVATQLGLTAAAAIGISTVLGIGIPLVTAIGAAWMRTRQEVEAVSLDESFKNVATALEDVAVASQNFEATTSDGLRTVKAEATAFLEVIQQVRAEQLAMALDAARAATGISDTLRKLDIAVSGVFSSEAMSGVGRSMEVIRDELAGSLDLMGLNVDQARKLDMILRTVGGTTRDEVAASFFAAVEEMRELDLLTDDTRAMIEEMAKAMDLVEEAFVDSNGQAEKLRESFASQKTEMEQQIALQRMALQFGEDSVAVRRLENQQAQKNLDTQLKAAGYTEDQRRELVAMLGIIQQNAAALRDAEGAANGLANALARASGVAVGLLAQVGGVVQGLKDQITALDQGSTAGLVALNRELNDLIETRARLDAKGADVTNLNKQIEATRAGLAEASKLTKDLETKQDALSSASKGAAKSAGTAEKALKGLREEVDRLNLEADPFATYAAGLERLNELSRAGLSDAAYSVELERMNEELVKADPLLNGLNDAFGQLIDYAFDGFKDGMRGIWGIFKRTLTNMIATAAKSRITFGLGMAGAGAGAASASGAGGAGVNTLGNMAGLLGGGAGTFFGGIGAGFSAATGAGSAGLFAVSANAATAVATGASAFTATIGAAIPVIGAVVGAGMLLKSAIGTTTKLTNAIEGRFELEGLTGGGEYDLKESDGWFSKGIEKNFEAWSGSWAEDIGRHADETFKNIAGQVRQSISDMGLEVQDFVHDFDFQFQEGSLEPGALYRVVEEEARKAGDAMLKAALEAAGLARENETGAETLQILNAAMNALNGTLALFGNEMLATDARTAGAARALIELTGGLDAFNTKIGFVFESFFTAAEKDAIALDQLQRTFEQMNVTLPETHAEFLALKNAQDLTTEGGRQLYAALLDVAPLFIQVRGTAEEVAQAMREQDQATDGVTDSAEAAARAADELARALAQMVAGFADALAQAERDLAAATNRAEAEYRNVLRIMDLQINEAEEAAGVIRNVFEILRDALQDRALLTIEAQRMRRVNALNELRGGISDPDRLSTVLDRLSEPSEELFSTFTDFARDYYRTSNVIANQKALAEDQLSEAEMQIELLRQQKQAIEDQYSPLLGIEENTNDLSEGLTRLEDAIRDVETATQRVETAIEALADALLLRLGTTVPGAEGVIGAGSGAVGSISDDRTNAILSDRGAALLSGLARDLNEVYRDELGRNIDVLGAEFYAGLVKTGQITLAQVAADLMGSPEAVTGVTPGFSGTTDAIAALRQIQASSGSGSTGGSTGGASGGRAVSGGGFADPGSPLWYAQYRPASVEGQINKAFNEVLQRNVDAAGLGFYSGLVRADNGFGIPEVYADLRKNAASDSGVPAFLTGTDYHFGGPARLHPNEMVNLPRGTGVSTADEVREQRTAMVSMAREVSRLREEATATKEYIRELVKINLKQERSLKEIEFQGETAT